MKTKNLKLENYLFPEAVELTVYTGSLKELRDILKEMGVGKKLTGGMCVTRGNQYYVFINENFKTHILDQLVHEMTHVVDHIANRIGIENEESGLIIKTRLLRYLVHETKDIIDWTEKEVYKASGMLDLFTLPKVKLVMCNKEEEFPKSSRQRPVIKNENWKIEQPKSGKMTKLYIKDDKEYKLENIVECVYFMVLKELSQRGVNDTETRAYMTGSMVSDLIEKH